MIRVLFFGPVVERIGNNQVTVAFCPGIRLQDVRDGLAAQYPQAFEIVCFAAANGQHVRDMSLQLADNNEVSFMAKFSGG